MEDMSDSSQHTPRSPQVWPAQSPRYSQSWPPCFCPESSYCFEKGWSVDWELFPPPSELCSWDCLKYHPRPNYAVKWSAEVVQRERQEHQTPPGEVDKDKDSNVEERDEPSRGLLRGSEKGLEPETCDGGDCAERDPASDGPGCLNCGSWLQRAFGRTA